MQRTPNNALPQLPLRNTIKTSFELIFLFHERLFTFSLKNLFVNMIKIFLSSRYQKEVWQKNLTKKREGKKLFENFLIAKRKSNENGKV